MENIPRVLPKGTVLPLLDWAWPQPFLEVQDRSGMSRDEMLQTLNCGVGLALVVSPQHVTAVENTIREHGYRAIPLGTLKKGETPSAEAAVEY